MLTAERVAEIRTPGKSDAYYARIWRVTRAAIRLARIGTTWPNHTTPPDLRPRKPGWRGETAALRAEPERAVDLSRLISGMRAPDNGEAKP